MKRSQTVYAASLLAFVVLAGPIPAGANKVLQGGLDSTRHLSFGAAAAAKNGDLDSARFQAHEAFEAVAVKPSPAGAVRADGAGQSAGDRASQVSVRTPTLAIAEVPAPLVEKKSRRKGPWELRGQGFGVALGLGAGLFIGFLGMMATGLVPVVLAVPVVTAVIGYFVGGFIGRFID